LAAGDIWIETDNNNQIYIYTGSSWSTTSSGAASSVDTTLQSQIDANELAIESNASNILLVAGVSGAQNISTSVNITTLNSAITDSSTGLAANASAISQLTTRVDDIDDDISLLTSDVTALNNTLTGYSGTNTVASAISNLQTQITGNDGEISATATAVDDLELALSGYTGSGAVASAIQGLQASIDTNEGNITSISQSVTSLNNSVSTINSTKTQTFVQTSAPTANAEGDLWIDSDDDNKLYRWNGSSWVAVNDTSGIAIHAQDR
jgi:prefoldin subunit 5